MNKYKISALTLVTLSAVSILTACGNADNKTSATSRNVNYSFGTDILTLDTSTAADVNSIDVLLNVDAGLVRWNMDAKPVNDLAKSIDVSKDGLTYNVTLRDGLKWSNGAKLTAQDFVYGWQRTVDPKTGSEYAFALSPVANANAVMTGKKPVNSLGIKAIDATHLVITLATPTPYFEKLLTLPAYYPVNQAFVKKMGSKYGTSSDTTLYNGAFKFVKGKDNWTGTNKNFSIVKNDNFYDAKNVKIPGVSYQIVNNPTTAVSLYKSGKLDVADLSTPELVAANKDTKGYKTLSSPRVDVLEYNQSGKVPALSNDKIREALNLATNRKALLSSIAPSFSIANTVTPKKLDTAPNGEDFATYAAQPYTYDATKAATLFKEGLKELGKTSLTLDLEGASDNTFAKSAVDYLKGNLEKALPGLTINENLVPAAQRLKDAQNHNFQILLTSWGADYNEPSDFLMNFVTGSTMNNGLVSNSAFDKAYTAATTAPDVLNASKRYADYKAAENELYKNSNVLPLATESVSLLMNPKLSGVSTYNSAMIFDLRHAHLSK
ncbi:peptide ABC transporter substrate-binding protein [Lactococcus protaetiae]|uniref:Peptide ABC transporter substrate-binding protein n=1 Tax=Lactococcus protaetiae TaxID=2592653 RepID=A0A514Z7W5_9LACT|nr:peptide ABC transporter substrate-binding protein [Lactococcus protaetiae]QDK70679.1 peptide ABC transporter substrate-binding protein [Lactococcus protaetiae]